MHDNNSFGVYALLFSRILILLLLPALLACEKNPIKPKVISIDEGFKQEVTKAVIKTERTLPKLASKEDVRKFCQLTQKSFVKYGWGRSRCESYPWLYFGKSNKGTPLLWVKFGDYEDDSSNQLEITLIMCGVHGDEITPIKFCFDSLKYLTSLEKGEVYEPESKNIAKLKGKFVALVPIVNPDSFFKKYPTRTNFRGVDINRNFPTQDFDKTALPIWKKRYKKDKRRFPGMKSMSEPETVFQVQLIQKFRPDKIISVHAPLTLLDYDGPVDLSSGGAVGPRANQLLIQMSQGAKGYKIKNYPFFPGSLGNYAGNERNIPTYTLELPSSDNRKSKKYWRLFKDAIHSAIMHRMEKDVEVAKKEERAPSDSKKAN